MSEQHLDFLAQPARRPSLPGFSNQPRRWMERGTFRTGNPGALAYGLRLSDVPLPLPLPSIDTAWGWGRLV